MNETNRQLLIGLPGSGKTTFLAALWHVVQADEVQTLLKLHSLHGERSYLNKIREDWLNYCPVERTKLGSEKNVSMLLQDSSGAVVTSLAITDFSGESFRLQWRERRWTNEYAELARTAIGCLLFIHPDQVVEPTSIDTANLLLAELSDGTQDNPTDPPVNTQWNPDDSPLQVQLVEFLQFILTQADRASPLRVAVIVSAWDLVEAEELSPEEWLKKHLPLFDQFLKSNQDSTPSSIYGVTAQGGDLAQDLDRIQSVVEPSKRIRVVNQDQTSHDLTTPLYWVTHAAQSKV